MTERSGAEELSRSCHVPVLVAEVLQWLEVQPGQTIVDGTVGGGGHSAAILQRLGPGGTLVGLDRDRQMLGRAGAVLEFPNCYLHQESYASLDKVLAADARIPKTVDAILLDLGVSSDQLADSSRGFGFEHDGCLDLRFDTSQGYPAADWLAKVDEGELEACLRKWGEEPDSRRIAAAIVARQRVKPVLSGRALADVVLETVGRRRGRRHPATRVFQALRIAVNQELVHLEKALADILPTCLASGGRIVVISFHSLEDRIVKQAFQDQEIWMALSSGPIRPSPREQRVNPRSRSARLRTAVRM
ncbi:MAG: 16S rRNA (cytosine(1402)-N(4))-methyltransferase RsmH [Planctomycetaceae bacterium]|jgi:16S rRNA (cytosine1402-N4)-methyltransferase|nr:16S rRNA (cytosine(1402)-N(4))-methyltransferase RsmH [Planctomycetaceae bacterium]